MPLVEPFQPAHGKMEDRDFIIAKIFSGGLIGWGETASQSAPYYVYETTKTCWHIQRDFLVPLLLNRNIDKPEEIVPLFAKIRGHNMAKTGIEQAIWDLFSKSRGETMAKTLGGIRNRVESGVSVGILDSRDRLLNRVEAYLKEGYKRIKIKIKPGFDVDVVREFRKRFDDVPLMVDANSSFTLKDAGRLKVLDEFDLLMIEQPLGYDDMWDHAKLQKKLSTSICLDESISTPDHARCALEMGSCRIINVKSARVGGVSQALFIHDLCQDRGVPVWCGGLLESGIGRAHNVALASLPNFELPGDISASKRYFARDVIKEPFELNADGTITVPTGPGIGVEVDEPFLKSVTVASESFS